MQRGVLVLIALVSGCVGNGSADGGTAGDAQGRTDHVLVSNAPQAVPAGTQVGLGPFQVPDGATVTYTIADTTGYDTMNVGVVDASTVNSLYAVAYGAQNGVSSTTGTTAALPAGVYDLVVQCLDILTSCAFNLTLVATY